MYFNTELYNQELCTGKKSTNGQFSCIIFGYILLQEKRLERNVGGIGSPCQLAFNVMGEGRMIDRYTREHRRGEDRRIVEQYL